MTTNILTFSVGTNLTEAALYALSSITGFPASQEQYAFMAKSGYTFRTNLAQTPFMIELD